MEAHYLTDEEIKILFKQIKEGNEKARTKLISKTIGIIYFCIKNRFNLSNNDLEDFVSIGTIGLIKAVDTFEPDKNIKFVTYAMRCISNEILMVLRKKSHVVEKSKVSYDTPIVEDETLTLKDMLFTLDNIEEEYCDNEEIAFLKEVVENLPEREKFVIMNYYGFNELERLNTTQIGKILGYSQSYTSRLVSRTQEKIKNQLIANGYNTETYTRTRK